MDISKTIEPNSEQINAEDLLSGDRVVTITGVRKGTTEQPVFIEVAEFPGRTYRPGKSMRRVMVAVWGPDSRTYIGRSLRIYNDPSITFGKQATGGIRISEMSHIDAPRTVNLTVSRGKRAPFTVRPLQADAVAPDGWQDDVAACASVGELTEFYEMAAAAGWWSAEVAAACTARKQELSDAEAT